MTSPTIGDLLLEGIDDLPEDEIDLFVDSEPVAPTEVPEERPEFINPPFIPA